MKFIALDFETANPQRGSVCAAGWAVVDDGEVVDVGSWLCRPPKSLSEFAPYNIGVHGITSGMVAGQPAFSDRAPDLLARIGSRPIVAHNAGFDRSVLAGALAASGMQSPALRWDCTLAWSKRLLLLPKYRLPLVCKHLAIEFTDHHDAGADALAAAQITLRLAELAGASTLAELRSAAQLPAVY